jgi:antitoxin component YwqK of YwqJK toxin-antitoxin module
VDQKGVGKPSLVVIFDEKGDKAEVQSASQEDGVIDTWQFYQDGQLVRLEKRSPGAAKVDQKVFFRAGHRLRSEQDLDQDGHFETRQYYDRPGWSSVVEVVERDGKVVRRSFYRDGRLALQESDDDRKGRITLREHFDAKGSLVKSEEERDDKGRLNFVFYYAPDGRARRAAAAPKGPGVVVW